MERAHDLSVRFQAFAVAMAAKAGTLQSDDLQQLSRMASLLDDGPLKQAVAGFVSQYRAAALHPQSRARLGHELLTYIDTLNVPVPPDMGRKDIHG